MFPEVEEYQFFENTKFKGKIETKSIMKHPV